MTGKKKYRLLMIDDDESLNKLLVEYFERFGHKLATAETAANGRYQLRRDDPDLLILDVMLPDADGMELCRTIRSESDIPIVMLTARGDLPDRVLGLEFGADDYIPKPFEPRELVARVETLMRRSRETPSRKLTARDGLVLEVRSVPLPDGRIGFDFNLKHSKLARPIETMEVSLSGYGSPVTTSDPLGRMRSVPSGSAAPGRSPARSSSGRSIDWSGRRPPWRRLWTESRPRGRTRSTSRSRAGSWLPSFNRLSSREPGGAWIPHARPWGITR